METKEEMTGIVQRAVAAYGKAEQACQDIADAMQDLSGIYKDGAKAGMATGSFVVKEIALFKQLTGRVGQMEEMIYNAHQRGTAIAKQNDADSVLPEGYVTLGGGDR